MLAEDEQSVAPELDEDEQGEAPPPVEAAAPELDEDELLARLFGRAVGLDSSLGLGARRLASLDLAGVAAWLRRPDVRVITLAGSGISTAAGIPDFRTPNCGLYDNLQQYGLPHPTAIFEIEYFKKHPEPFFNLAKKLYPGRFKPTITHYFLRLLSEKGLLLRHFTQNIDALERLAGLPLERLVEAHGTFLTSRCLECGVAHELDWLKQEVFADRVARCSKSASCNGLVKPDIVFFGESLPERFVERLTEDFPQCTLLIVMGTSLHVAPFCQLIGQVEADVPRAYFNKQLTSSATAEEGLLGALGLGGGASGLRCGQSDNYRDVFVQGACDDSCLQLAELLGWKEELQALYKTEHERLDREHASDPDYR